MILELLLFTAVLSVDSFSAAIALGFRHFSWRRALFFALSSGLSEGLATAIGFLLGRIARNLIMDYDHWVAFALLVAVGGHMCWAAYMEQRNGAGQDDELKVHGPFRILFVPAITSIDSLGVGVSLGIVNKPIGIYSAAIGLGAFVSTYLGLFLARRISGKLGGKVEMFAGGVLIALGIKMLSI